MDRILEIVTVLSFVYALYQGREMRRVASFFRDQSWSMYYQTYRVMQQLQRIAKEPDNRDLVVMLSNKGDAFGQSLLEDTVRLIKRFAPRYDEEIIDEWIKTKRIWDPGHRDLFFRITDFRPRKRRRSSRIADEQREVRRIADESTSQTRETTVETVSHPRVPTRE